MPDCKETCRTVERETCFVLEHSEDCPNNEAARLAVLIRASVDARNYLDALPPFQDRGFDVREIKERLTAAILAYRQA